MARTPCRVSIVEAAVNCITLGAVARPACHSSDFPPHPQRSLASFTLQSDRTSVSGLYNNTTDANALSYLDGTLPGDYGFDPLGLLDPVGKGGFVDPSWLKYSEVNRAAFGCCVGQCC